MPPTKAKSEAKSSGEQQKALHTRTAIIGYDLIPWKVETSVSGAIKAMLYGEEDSPQKAAYKSSPAGRENKKVLTEFAGQIYTYLNGSISEYADIKDYKFRVWADVRVNSETGAIIGRPIFDVELYRYVGRVNAQSVEVEDESSKVLFVGIRDDQFLTPFILKALTRAGKSTKSLKVELYNDRESAPRTIKPKLLGASPTLVIDDDSFAIKSKPNKDGSSVVPFLEDGKRVIEFTDADDVLRFILDKTGLKPEVFGLNTGFQRVDQELEKISTHIQEEASPKKAAEVTDFIADLGLDSRFKEISAKLKGLKPGDSAALKRRQTYLNKVFAEIEKSYGDLQSQHETELEHLSELQSDFKKSLIEYSTYDVQRVKSITNRRRIEEELLDIRDETLPEFTKKIDSFGKVESDLEENEEKDQ